MVVLQEATTENIHEVWEMQIKAFEDLIRKYQDYDMSPGAESFENIMMKFNQPWTKYYFILDGEDNWSLDTIMQEEGNVHLYEKVGYHQTGEIEHIKDGMDIVFFEKN